jgi:type VI secretion system secreted protein Hcp
MSREEANRIARAVQRVRRTRSSGLKLGLPTAAVLGAGAAVAIGSIPGGDGTITACYVTNTDLIQEYSAAPGELRVIDTSQPATLPSGGPNAQGACLNGEATITWNQRGPQGPQGAPGAQGATGPAGAPLIGQTSFGFSGGGRTFLKLDGIEGESTAKDHKGEIEVSSFSIGASGAQHGSGGGGGAGKVSFSSFTITKKLDKASPALFKAAAQGTHFKEATIVFRKAGKGQQEFLEYKLNSVLISSIQDGTSQKASPIEQVTFKFAKIEETFLGRNGKPLQTISINVSAQNKLN